MPADAVPNALRLPRVARLCLTWMRLGGAVALVVCMAVGVASANPGRQAAALAATDRFLDEDYAGAHALLDSLARVEPDRPEPYLGKALAYWDEGLIFEKGSDFKGEIDRQIEKSIQAAENHLKEHGESAEMMFWLGNAKAVASSVAITYGDLIDALVAGLESREFLEDAIRRDPGLVDAYFGLGLADYVIARQPRLLRAVSRLFSLPSGDRDLGLSRLELVAAQGTYCQRHAASARAFIALYYDKQFDEARERFTDLHRRYPNSLDYRMRYLDSVLALTAMGRDGYQHALIDSARSIRRLASERGWPLETWTRTKLDFVEGLGSYLVGEHGLAAESLQTYVAEADRKSWLLGPAELILGKIADLRGDRASATDHYRKVRRHENVWNAHQEAERYLSDPFDGQEPGSRPPDPVKRYPRQP